MSDTPDDIKAQFLAVLRKLNEDERRLLSEVLRAEALRLSEKAPNMRGDLLKIVKQVIS